MHIPNGFLSDPVGDHDRRLGRDLRRRPMARTANARRGSPVVGSGQTATISPRR